MPGPGSPERPIVVVDQEGFRHVAVARHKRPPGHERTNPLYAIADRSFADHGSCDGCEEDLIVISSSHPAWYAELVGCDDDWCYYTVELAQPGIA